MNLRGHTQIWWANSFIGMTVEPPIPAIKMLLLVTGNRIVHLCLIPYPFSLCFSLESMSSKFNNMMAEWLKWSSHWFVRFVLTCKAKGHGSDSSCSLRIYDCTDNCSCLVDLGPCAPNKKVPLRASSPLEPWVITLVLRVSSHLGAPFFWCTRA